MALSSTDEAQILAEVKRYFPHSSDGDGHLVVDTCSRFDVGDVLEGVREHRAEKGDRAFSPDARRVAGIAADRLRRRTATGAVKERIIDFVRAENPKVKGLDEVSALLAHYSEAWATLRDDADTPADGREKFRAMIYRAVITGLQQLGKGETEATAAARDVIELRDGESVIIRRTFQSPQDTPEKWDELRRLARRARDIRLGGQPPEPEYVI